MYQCRCHTCEESFFLEDLESAQSVFVEHVDDGHEVVLERIDPPIEAPRPTPGDEVTGSKRSDREIRTSSGDCLDG